MSFAIEEIKTIVVSRGKAHRIYTNTGGQIGVHSSNINHQLVVEVHPHIVITLKLEELTSLVSKTSVNLHAEGKIVNLTILTKGMVAPTQIIHRKEIGLLECILSASTSDQIQRQVVWNFLVFIGAMPPVVEGCGTVDGSSGTHSGVSVDWSTISLVQSSTVLEVIGGVAFISHKSRLTIEDCSGDVRVMGGAIHVHRHLEIRELKSFSSIGISTASLGLNREY